MLYVYGYPPSAATWGRGARRLALWPRRARHAYEMLLCTSGSEPLPGPTLSTGGGFLVYSECMKTFVCSRLRVSSSVCLRSDCARPRPSVVPHFPLSNSSQPLSDSHFGTWPRVRKSTVLISKTLPHTANELITVSSSSPKLRSTCTRCRSARPQPQRGARAAQAATSCAPEW